MRSKQRIILTIQTDLMMQIGYVRTVEFLVWAEDLERLILVVDQARSAVCSA
tara:strand:+ start:544 stop:699 length:156 start_codon:yes stop_codon:yes gene_type:complete